MYLVIKLDLAAWTPVLCKPASGLKMCGRQGEWEVRMGQTCVNGREGSRDASHSRWTVAWCLTMSKSRRVFLFRLMFFLGLLFRWLGGRVWVTPRRKNCHPAHLCLAVTANMRILALLRSSHDIALSMAPMLMHTRPDPNHVSSLLPLHPGKPPHRRQHAMSHPMTTQDVPHPLDAPWPL